MLQVVDTHYKIESQNISTRRIVEYPYRGLIYDRNGKMLVENTPVFDLMVVVNEMQVEDTAKFCRLFGITKEDFNAKIGEIKDRKNRQLSPAKPCPFIKQMSITDFAKVQDYLVDFKGFFPQERTVRSYPLKSMANALGYIGEIDKRQLERQKEKYYQAGDYIGINGLEAQYEEHLRGKRGVRYVLRDVKGVEKDAFKGGLFDTASVPGHNLIATVDLDLQKYGEQLMEYKIGSVVAIEPSSGEILAFISSPTYDPNLLAGRDVGKNFEALNNDTLLPLFNRPLMAMYPPGSIFKLAQALIGMEMGVINKNTVFPCNKALVNCHPHQSPVDVKGSVQHSCNPYYYMVFKNIIEQGKYPSKYQDSEHGFDVWYDRIRKFGFGQKLKVDLPGEKPGIIPSNSFYDRYYGNMRWKFSTIYSLSIGQGEVSIIPLQMANLAAIVANRGYYYTPHMVRGIGQDGNKLPDYKVKHEVGISREHFEPVIEGMEQVVLAGTAARSRIKDISMCGKTGTAQNPHGEDHSVFIAFAPKDNPKIAIAVFVENAGFGGTWAAPIASLMIEKYLTDTITRPQFEKTILDKRFFDQLPDQNVIAPVKKPASPKKPASGNKPLLDSVRTRAADSTNRKHTQP